MLKKLKNISVFNILKNKEIKKLRIAITTQCNCRCPYCFVEKTNENISLSILQKGIRLLIESKGQKKLLTLYGGEPLLVFNLAKRGILFAKKLAKKHKKRVVISLVTNMTLLNERYLKFLKENNVHLIVSLVGEKKYHDKHRMFPNRIGSFDAAISKIPMIWQFAKKETTGVCFCIFPDTVKFLFKNFIYLMNLGFRNFNLEVIIDQNNPWSKKDITYFSINLKAILRLLLKNIKNKDYFYLRPISLEIAYKKLTEEKKGNCPFSYDLYLYPDGALTFSPFLSRDYAIAHLGKNEIYNFEKCHFSKNSPQCHQCKNNYWERIINKTNLWTDQWAEKIHQIYSSQCFLVSKYIVNKAKFNSSFAEYVKKIKENT